MILLSIQEYVCHSPLSSLHCHRPCSAFCCGLQSNVSTENIPVMGGCHETQVTVCVYSQVSQRQAETFGMGTKGAFHFIRTDWPDHSRHNDNVPFNQNSPARSVESWIVCTKEMVLLQKLLEKAYFIFKLTGWANVRPASSDKWKAH